MPKSSPPEPKEPSYAGYRRQFVRRGRREPDLAAAMANPKRFAVPRSWWPQSKDARIIEIGCGWGDELLNLWAGGYASLVGVDSSESQLEIARRCLPREVDVICRDAFEHLADNKDSYDLVVCLDMIEHLAVEDGIRLVGLAREALVPGGAFVLRTLNMASVLGGFTRYIDLTHKTGFTEFSLYQLLDAGGMVDHEVLAPRMPPVLRAWRPWAPWRGFSIRERLARRLNNLLHRILFGLRQQWGSASYDMNLTVRSHRPASGDAS